MAKLISTLNVGDKIKLGKHQVNTEIAKDIIWQVADKNHAGYPASSVTLLADKIIDLRGFDAMEPSNSDANRKTRGSNRYLHSNLRQWLNKGGNPWFVKANATDEPPTDAGTNGYGTGYDTKNGFLSAFNTDELGAILDTTLTVAKNTVTDGGGTETVVDKAFLLSNTEVGLANETGGAEGSLLPLFSSDASRISKLTEQCFLNTKSTSKPATINDGWVWWLRSPGSSYSNHVRYVNSTGSLNYYHAYDGDFGVRPALNLKSDILVSDLPDSDGAYTVEWTNVISKDLTKVDDTNFTWNVETIGVHTGVKSQIHIYDNLGALVTQGAIKDGVGIQSDTIIPTTSGTFKAKVKLWSNVTVENWSNEITYEITVTPHTITFDKPINIGIGEKMQQVKFDITSGLVGLNLKSIDSTKLTFEGKNLNTDKVDLTIDGKNATINKIAYVVI